MNDERVVNQKRKITNEAFSFMMLFLIGSVLVKQFVLHAEFSAYAIEFIGFFGAAFYILIRNIVVGTPLFREGTNKKKTIFLNSLAPAVTIMFLAGYDIIKGEANFDEAIFSMILAVIVSVIATWIAWSMLTKLNQRRMEQLEKELDEEEYNV